MKLGAAESLTRGASSYRQFEKSASDLEEEASRRVEDPTQDKESKRVSSTEEQ